MLLFPVWFKYVMYRDILIKRYYRVGALKKLPKCVETALASSLRDDDEMDTKDAEVCNRINIPILTILLSI